MSSFHITLVAIHGTAGALAIVFGFIALLAAKGAIRHRWNGNRFVYAMLTMTLLGVAAAMIWGKAPGWNIPVGLLTAYLVMTGATAFRRETRLRLDALLMLVAAATALLFVAFGFEAAAMSSGSLYGRSAARFFIFAIVGLIAAAGDLRKIRNGELTARARLVRHLWRMTVGLLVPTAAFFLGLASVLPKPFGVPFVVPPLFVLGFLCNWLWRTRVRSTATRPALNAADQTALPAMSKAPRRLEHA